ncbi:hypothetical protein CDL57_27605 [Escherichia coli]|nr:hypothetical protein CDL57_27605 [Escherichia coli]
MVVQEQKTAHHAVVVDKYWSTVLSTTITQNPTERRAIIAIVTPALVGKSHALLVRVQVNSNVLLAMVQD